MRIEHRPVLLRDVAATDAALASRLRKAGVADDVDLSSSIAGISAGISARISDVDRAKLRDVVGALCTERGSTWSKLAHEVLEPGGRVNDAVFKLSALAQRNVLGEPSSIGDMVAFGAAWLYYGLAVAGEATLGPKANAE